MAYATSSDLNNRYGSVNISLWADTEGQGSSNANIATRTAAALAWATDRIDARLRGSPLSFTLPLTGTIPTVLVDVCVKLAGYWLSTARGVKDYDDKGKPMSRLYVDYQEALETLEEIAQQRLDVGIAK